MNKLRNGMISGSAVCVIAHPTDTYWYRLLLNNKPQKLGIKSLYNGVTFNIISTGIKGIALFSVQDVVNDIFIRLGYSKAISSIYSGICAGVVLGTIANPINAIKVPLQVSYNRITTANACKQIYNKYKLRGFYNGGLSIFLRDLTYSTVYFPLFTYLYNNSNMNKLCCTMISGMTSVLISYPFNCVRLYRQDIRNNISFMDAFKKSFELSTRNFKSLIIMALRIPLLNGLTHIIYMRLNKN